MGECVILVRDYLDSESLLIVVWIARRRRVRSKVSVAGLT